MSIAERLAAIRAELPPTVRLVAVSKTQPPEAIREAYAAGQRDFGENYAQEWRAKADALADLTDLSWHFIGGLQSNKVKYLAGRAAWIHTVDGEPLAREIGRRYAAKGVVARVLLEVNVAREPQKAGCAPEEVGALADAVRGLAGVELRGLMCIPPAEGDPRPHFASLRALGARLGLPELSMGMSADWRDAVAEGSTMVRIGTAVFGPRPAR